MKPITKQLLKKREGLSINTCPKSMPLTIIDTIGIPTSMNFVSLNPMVALDELITILILPYIKDTAILS